MNTPEGSSGGSFADVESWSPEAAEGDRTEAQGAPASATDPHREGARNVVSAQLKVPASVEAPALAGHGHDLFAPEILHPAVDLAVREWTLVIPGQPVAKGRPKLATVSGHAMAFTPKKTRNYESIVRETAVREWNRPILENVPVTMRCIFFLPIAQSWPKKRQQAARLGDALPIAKPDLSNLAKAIEDGMNGVVYYDDSLIVKTMNEKRYADSPRVEVTLSWVTR